MLDEAGPQTWFVFAYKILKLLEKEIVSFPVVICCINSAFSIIHFFGTEISISRESNNSSLFLIATFLSRKMNGFNWGKE